MPRIEPYRVVRGREHDALDALLARRLEQIVAADDIGLQDVIPRPLDRKSAEMQDAVDTLADRLDLRRVRQFCRLEFFVSAEIGRRFQVAQQQVRIDRRQQLSQACADSTGRAGHQYAWHFIPRSQSIESSMARLPHGGKASHVARWAYHRHTRESGYPVRRDFSA